MYRIYDWLIPEQVELIELTRAKTLISLLLACLILTLILIPIQSIIASDFPVLITCIGIITLIVIFKITKSTFITGNLTICLIFLALFSTIFKSGGIYSHDLAGMVIIVIISISVANTKTTLFWILAVACMICYFYYNAQNPANLDIYKIQRGSFPIEYYLVVNLALLALPSAFVFILASLNKKLVRTLRSTNAELDISHDKLSKETQKLSYTKSQLESSNQKLERYAHAASHDLKQPIRTIYGFTQLLSKRLNKLDINDSKMTEYIEYINSGATRMDKQVQELLSYSVVNSNDNISVQNVQEILQEVIQDLKSQIDGSKVIFKIGQMPEIKVRRTNLSQVFQNLISNAIKYKKNDVPLSLNIFSIDNQDEWVFCIEDNGIGIEEEKQGLVFDLFSQSDNGSEGQGIGLSTCKEIIESYHGRIWVDSKIGRGSKFCFSLPKID